MIIALKSYDGLLLLYENMSNNTIGIIILVIFYIIVFAIIALSNVLEDSPTQTDAGVSNRGIAVHLCKDDITAQNRIESLLNSGYRYQGPVNNNGNNCDDVLFVRP